MGQYIGKAIGLRGAIPLPEGPHKSVGIIRFRPTENAPFVQLFYPAQENHSNDKRVLYMRKEAAEGMAKWLGYKYLGFVFSGSLTNIPHPFVEDAPLHSRFTTEEKLPVILFSHGLGGTSEMYSKVCSDLASYGYLVVAMEHEDGSGSYAKPQGSADPVYYRGPPADMPYKRNHVIEFRKPFLEQRTGEIKAVIEFIHKKTKYLELNGVSDDNVALMDKVDVVPAQGESKANAEESAAQIFFSLDKLFERVDPEKLFLGGHSFGAATTVHSSHDTLVAQSVKGTFLLDLWPFPVSHEYVAKGVPLETLSILTEQFAKNDESPITLELAQNSEDRFHSYYIPGTTHQQYSDAPWFMSEKLAKSSYSLGSLSKSESQRVLTKAIVDFVRGERDLSHLTTSDHLRPFDSSHQTLNSNL